LMNNGTLTKTKEAFLLLCQQYNNAGLYLEAEARAIMGNDPVTGMTARKNLLAQYQEMGEQLKVLGAAIDALGGPPILQPDTDNPGAG